MTGPLTTDRLSLRPIRAGDWPELCGLDGDLDVMATLGGLRSEKETVGYAMAQEDHWRRHGFGWWMAHDLETGAFVGRGGIRYLEIDGVMEVEVGYAVVRERWGRGFATEIARAGVELAYDGVGLTRVVGITLVTNGASRRVLDKLDFAYERDLTHAGLPHVLYAWEARAP
jgi:[ribosomal protein S5]-alanine N-acetyltransferase